MQYQCVPILIAGIFKDRALGQIWGQILNEGESGKRHGENSLTADILKFSLSPGRTPSVFHESLLSLAAFCCEIVGSTIFHLPRLQVLWSMQAAKAGITAVAKRDAQSQLFALLSISFAKSLYLQTLKL